MEFATITTEELKEKLDKGERIQLLDIRTFDAFWKERIRGAKSLPYDRIFDRAELLDPAKLIVLYGEDEFDPFVGRAAEIILNRGFEAKTICIYKDGLLGWRVASYFTTSGDEPISS